jgi:hypothetical protein
MLLVTTRFPTDSRGCSDAPARARTPVGIVDAAVPSTAPFGWAARNGLSNPVLPGNRRHNVKFADTPRRASPGPLAATQPPSTSARVAPDAIFVAIIALATTSLYIRGLGFYSDDWAFWAAAEARSEGGLVTAMLDVGMRTRPVQAVYTATLYGLFGLNPVGYHVVNASVLAAISSLLYLWLRRIGVSRLVAIAIPIVYVSLPHFSTARFWIAAFQANAAVLFLAGCFYADARWIQEPRSRRWSWKMLAVGAVVISALAYEMTAALLVLSPFLAWFATKYLRPTQGRVSGTEFLAGAALNALALVAAVAFKASTTARTGTLEHLHWWLPYAAREAVSVHFGTYGIGLPMTVLQALRYHFDGAALLLSLLVGAAAAAYLHRAQRESGPGLPPRRTWAWLAAVGLGLFAAGYAAVLMTMEIGFHATGINNRTAGAAAVGTAVTLVAVSGWLCTWLPSDRARRLGTIMAFALITAAGTLVTNVIASHWRTATGEQERVIRSLLGALPAPSSGATILLDGFCPYAGPGVVFETKWDVSGMLRLYYGDNSLQGDVLSRSSRATEEGLRTILYDDVINVYPYGDKLFVVRPLQALVTTLSSRAAAEAYMEASAASRDCPEGVAGSGVRIF